MGFVGSITVVVLLALAGVGVLQVANLPYLPLIHGSTANEVERLAAWLDLQPGTRVADLGAGDGTFAVALARIVGPSGHVYATELDSERLAVFSERSVSELSSRSVKVYISLVTMSVSSPTPRAKSCVSSRMGVRISA